MSLIPEEKIKSHLSLNLAPMIDFLFLMLAVFATLAVTRATLFDTEVDLVKLQKEKESSFVTPRDHSHQINLSISSNGDYKWITDVQDYQMENLDQIQKELLHQYSVGLLPNDKNQTQILLHIDKSAPWEKIAKLLFAVRETGFDAHPIYAPDEKTR